MMWVKSLVSFFPAVRICLGPQFPCLSDEGLTTLTSPGHVKSQPWSVTRVSQHRSLPPGQARPRVRTWGQVGSGLGPWTCSWDSLRVSEHIPAEYWAGQTQGLRQKQELGIGSRKQWWELKDHLFCSGEGCCTPFNGSSAEKGGENRLHLTVSTIALP